MRAFLSVLFLPALLLGCAATTGDHPDGDRPGQALAELRIEAGLDLGTIQRVTVEGGGTSQDVQFEPTTGTFEGTLILPTGLQTLVARAFDASDFLVGQSQPVVVDVEAFAVTRVELRILDLTTPPPQSFGPIFDSLTFPTSIVVGASARFELSVILPGATPVFYGWTSSCADSTFETADAAVTAWTPASPGSCTITVAASTSASVLSRSFSIVVFPAGTSSGAVDATGVFITAPRIGLVLGELGCQVFPDGNGSCDHDIASPSTTTYDATVFSWGGSSPRSIELSDDCGGRVGVTNRAPDEVRGTWLPPVGGGLCMLTVRAVSNDAVVGTVTAAVLVRPGSPATASVPRVFAAFDTGCPFNDASAPSDCGVFGPNANHFVVGSVSQTDGHPGALTIDDSCFGPLPTVNYFFFNDGWPIAEMPGATCTTTVTATTLEGPTVSVAGRYRIATP